MPSQEEKTLRFTAEVDSTPKRVAAVAKLFDEALSSAAEDSQTGTVTMTVANRTMVATLNPRDPAALSSVASLANYVASPGRAGQTEEGRAVLRKIREFFRTMPLDAKFEYGGNVQILSEEYWESVTEALGDALTGPTIEEETFVYGRVSSVADTGKVKLQLDDGTKHTFAAADPLMDASARLFRQEVYAKVTFSYEMGLKKPGALLSICGTRQDADIVESLGGLRSKLKQNEISVTTEWLKD